jgi:VCBS repeat-containing protein
VADAAVLGTGSGTVKEDTPAQSTASGTLSIVDPDAGEAVFQPQTNVAGTYGSFSVNTAGAWTYTIDNTLPVVQALKEGETRNESFTVLQRRRHRHHGQPDHRRHQRRPRRQPQHRHHPGRPTGHPQRAGQ